MSNRGWIAVDLDGTLALYDGWHGETHIGDPIPRMAERVKTWLDENKDVRIFTARVSLQSRDGDQAAVDLIRDAVQTWTQHHFGVRLPVVCEKDYGTVELWDDRAVQVIPNTGVRADGQPG